MKGMQLFDNYEEDGQLSLFSADYDDWDEDWEEIPEEVADDAEQPKAVKEVAEAEEEPAVKVAKGKSGALAKTKAASGNAGSTPKQKAVVIGEAVDTYEKAVAGLEITNAGPAIRVKYCASCGKLLFVREETAGFHSECNNCGIKYFQKL